jgi:hypothetical protein
VQPTSGTFAFVYDYNQFYLYDAAHEAPSEGNEYLDALDAATAAGLTVGFASGIVDVLMPRQENFSAQLELSITGSPPRRLTQPTTSLSSISPQPPGGSRWKAPAAPGWSRLRCHQATIARASPASTSTLPRLGRTTIQAIRPITTASNCGQRTVRHLPPSYDDGPDFAGSGDIPERWST